MKHYLRPRKLILATVLSLLLAVAVSAISIITIPHRQVKAIESEMYSVIDDISIDSYDCEIDYDHCVIQTGEDPHIIIDGFETEICKIRFSFKDPLEEGCIVRLYYRPTDGDWSESRNINVYDISEDRKTLTFYLYSGISYDKFRLDINFSYRLSDISVSNSPDSFVSVSVIDQLKDGDYSYLNPLQMAIAFLVFELQSVLIIINRDRLLNTIRRFRDFVFEDRRKLILALLFLIGSTALSLVVSFFYNRHIQGIYCIRTAIPFVLGPVAITAILFYGKKALAHASSLFFIVSMCIGLSFIAITPNVTLTSWDDEIHYRHALQVSYCGEYYYTEADAAQIDRTINYSTDLENSLLTEELLNDEYDNGWTGSNSYFSIQRFICYLPMGAGIWLGRVLGMSFSHIFMFGRITNLLVYCLMISAVLGITKRFRLMISLFAMIPTLLFMACNYSYDPICVSGITLAFAIFFRTYQDSDYKLTKGRALMMLGAAAFGCLPKQIYFPVFVLLLFVPKDSFESRSDRRFFYGIIILGVLVIIASFMAPFILSGGNNKTDLRGGSDVSAPGQIAYIFSHPVQYTKTLLTFLFGSYFNPREIVIDAVKNFYFISFYFNRTFKGAYIFLLPCLYAFLFDRPGEDLAITCKKKPGSLLKFLTILIFFGTCVLMATALYVSFTPVGNPTIEGCQKRYLLPLLPPLLMFLSPGLCLKKRNYDQIASGIIIFVTLLWFLNILLLMRY
ncbi:MAG: DUF2142 domain-containing protein [Clostridiales bacterium]|nr:DUF2142 domain-containing protein [Clostridiales bacterium]